MTKEEREQAIKRLTRIKEMLYSADAEAVGMAIQALKQEPTGHWIIDIDNTRIWDKKRFYCSECGDWQTYGETKFCMNCGMPMGKENR